MIIEISSFFPSYKNLIPNLNFRVEASFEHGLTTFLYLKMKEALKLRAQKKVDVYETIDTFVEDVSRMTSPNVKLKNLGNLLFYFGIILVIVSLVAVIDILLFKYLQTINCQLLRCLVIAAEQTNFGEALLRVTRVGLKAISLKQDPVVSK